MLGLVFSLTLLAATPAQVPSVPLPPELSRVLRDYESAWTAGDAAALASLFADDGFVLPNGAPPVSGRDAIREYYKGPHGPLYLRAISYATQGPVGYIIGAFSRQEGQPDAGKFTLTLRKNEDGRWVIVSDMDNGNRRPQCSGKPEAIAAASQKLIAADNARDLAAVLDGYTNDVIWYAADGKTFTGKAQIRPRYEELFSKFNVALTSTIDEAKADGGIGFIRGTNSGTLTPLAGGDPVTVHDRFIALVRCEESTWRVSHLMWIHF